jgi:hypothetical protein
MAELIGGRIYKGNYMSGGGFLMDAFRHLIPIIKGYSKKKVLDFTSDLAGEVVTGTNIKEAFAKSGKKTGRKIVKDIAKDIIGGRIKKKTKKKRKTKSDFFGI